MTTKLANWKSNSHSGFFGTDSENGRRGHLYSDLVPSSNCRNRSHRKKLIERTSSTTNCSSRRLNPGYHNNSESSLTRRHQETFSDDVPAFQRCRDLSKAKHFNGRRRGDFDSDANYSSKNDLRHWAEYHGRSNNSPNNLRLEQHRISTSKRRSQLDIPVRNSNLDSRANESASFEKYPSDQRALQNKISHRDQTIRPDLSWERKFHRLQCQIADQESILKVQANKLKQFTSQIENYEAITHAQRISEDGPDYIYRSYLGYVSNETPVKSRIRSQQNEERDKPIPLSSSIQGTRHSETAVWPVTDSGRLLSVEPEGASSTVHQQHELAEAEKLTAELDSCVSTGQRQSLQLLDISREVTRHDELISQKRLLCEQLEAELQQLIDSCETNREQNFVASEPVSGHTELGTESGILRTNLGRREQNLHSKLFLSVIDSDTGLSSMGSESPVELSPF